MNDRELYELILWTIEDARVAFPNMPNQRSCYGARIDHNLRIIEAEIQRRRTPLREDPPAEVSHGAAEAQR